MRSIRNPRLERGEVRIEDIALDHKCRDDLIAILIGIKRLYLQEDLRERLFALLDKYILPGTNRKVGRPGMDMWTYIAQVSSSVAGKSTDLLMRPLSHEFFCALALSAAKKHLNSVKMSPVRMPWRQDGRVFWNAGQTCPAAFVLFFFDEVWFSSGQRSRAYRW